MTEKRQGSAEAAALPLIAFGVLVLLILGFMAIQIVPSGHVRTVATFGDVAEQELQPGLHFVMPVVQSTRQYSVQSQTYTMSGKTNEGNKMRDDTIQALTTEGLNIEMDISVRYHLKPEYASNVHRNIGTERQIESKVVRPTVRAAVRSSTSNFSVNEIYSEKRDELADDIKENILAGLASKNYKEAFVIERVQVRNVMLPDKVRDAIQRKEMMQQRIQSKAKAVKVERKEKQRKIVEAQGIAKSNKIIGDSLSRAYLRWYFIQEGLPNVNAMYVPMSAQNGGLPLYKNVDQVPDGSINMSDVIDSNTTVQDKYGE